MACRLQSDLRELFSQICDIQEVEGKKWSHHPKDTKILGQATVHIPNGMVHIALS